MRREYCYLPILRAKQGEFRAVAALSPLARARLIPMFDLPSPVLRNGESLESFLAECAIGAYKAWGSTRSVYVDIHDIPPDVRTRSAQQPVEHLFDVLRDHGMLAIPVTGTEADRGSDYLTAVRSIAGRDQRGACLRLAHDDLTQPYTLAHAVKTTLDHLSLSTLSVDVVLDFRCIGGHKIDDLRAIILESLQALFTVGEFRNMVLAGGSVPQVLGKRDVGVERRVMRAEFGLWQYIAKNSRGNVPIALGDYGVIYAHYVPPQGRVIVPPRIRYTAAREHAFYRGKHGEYRTLCEQV